MNYRRLRATLVFVAIVMITVMIQSGHGETAYASVWRPSPAWRGELSRLGRASCPRSTLRWPARRRNLSAPILPPSRHSLATKSAKGN